MDLCAYKYIKSAPSNSKTEVILQGQSEFLQIMNMPFPRFLSSVLSKTHFPVVLQSGKTSVCKCKLHQWKSCKWWDPCMVQLEFLQFMNMPFPPPFLSSVLSRDPFSTCIAKFPLHFILTKSIFSKLFLKHRLLCWIREKPLHPCSKSL